MTNLKINLASCINVFAWASVLLPILQLAYGFYQVQFAGDIFYYGPEPAKAVVHTLGLWAMGFLWLVLSVRHLKRWLKLNLQPVRRRLGLILGFELSELIPDLEKRPYILIGALAILLLLPLAITSTRGWQRRLKRQWKTLHLLVYPVSVLVLIHIWWQVRAGFLLAAAMTVLLCVIFILRFLPNRLAQVKTSSNL